jgi:hypothetical protein
MADTKRTLADLLANLFQDGQSVGSITAQDLRDFLVSVQPCYGACYVSASGVTTITTADTPVKAAGTTTLLSGGVNVDDDGATSNRLRYTGTFTKHFFVSASVSMTSATGGDEIGLHLAKNGVVIAASEILRTTNASSDHGAAYIHAGVDLAANDYVELWVDNNDNTNNVTITKMNLHMIGHIG